jgi:hypothetical protein
MSYNKILFALVYNLLVYNFAFSHGGMAPPVDVQNRDGTSHSGFGNYSGNDYDASQILRKSCLKENIDNLSTEIRNECLRRNPDFSVADHFKLLGAGAELATQNRLQSYTASILSSDIGLAKGPPNRNPEPNSCHGIDNGVIPPHLDVRKGAMSVENALSAAFLATYLNPGSDDAYIERIRRNYPYLYTPIELKPNGHTLYAQMMSAASAASVPIKPVELEWVRELDGHKTSGANFKILSLLKESLGSAYKGGNGMYDHSETMDAVEAKMQTDPEFKRKIESAVHAIQKEYANYQEKNLASICSMSMEEISKKFPGIFDQFLIDQANNDKASSDLARFSLCQKKFYYDPSKFDSDCDGVVDSQDTKPGDPFSPVSSFKVENENFSNPPFNGTGLRNISKTDKKVTLSRDIALNIGGGADKAVVLEKMNKCSSDLKKTIGKSYKEFANKNEAFKDVELDIKFNFKESSTNSDFKIHECWCSTCKLYYNDPVKGKTRVPRNTCRKDFTPEMVAALTDSSLNPNPSQSSWAMQEDAGNLTITSLDNCRTIKHEMMHLLGFADEYNADYYPFNLIGKHDSLLSGGEKLYPRHIGDILTPAKCERSRGNYGL